MNITLVDPIAATANVTGRTLFSPDIPPVGRDPQALRETKVVELAAQIARSGHRVTVLLGDLFVDGHGGTTPEGVRIVSLETVMRFPFHPGLIPATPSLLGNSALRDADVMQVSEFHQPSTFFSCVAAHEGSVPVVLWQETFRHMRFPGSAYQRAFESICGPFVQAHTKKFIPRTTRARDYLHSLGAPEDRIGHWIPTGIDVDAFVPRQTRSSRADFGWPEDSPVILLVGRLHRSKGVDLAIRALKQVTRSHPDARLVIRGSGPEQNALMRLANDLGLDGSVRFIGRKSREAMIDLYNLADVVLCTSRVDLLPFSLIEAAACGRPAVASDVGAIRDIVVDGRTGVLVGGGDIEGFSTAICSLLDTPDLAASMGRAARERAERCFAMRLMAQRLIEVYRDVAS